MAFCAKEPAHEAVLVTGDHGLGVAAVRHEGEAVPAQREVALMGFHGGDDHAFWQLQKSFVEDPREDHRTLDEIDDLRQDAFVGLLESQIAQSLRDGVESPGLIDLDISPPQALEVLAGVRDLDFTPGEAMAERRAAEAVECFLVELCAKPPDRARKANPTFIPHHRLGEREPLDQLIESLGKSLCHRTTPSDNAEKSFPNLQLVHGNALLAGKAFGGRLPEVLRRALDPFIGLAIGKIVGEQNQPTRRRVDLPASEDGQPISQLAQGLLARRSRKLLAADLKQERRQASPRTARLRGAPGCAPARCRRLARWPRSPPARRAD
jgi:hypothetical protein